MSLVLICNWWRGVSRDKNLCTFPLRGRQLFLSFCGHAFDDRIDDENADENKEGFHELLGFGSAADFLTHLGVGFNVLEVVVIHHAEFAVA